MRDKLLIASAATALLAFPAMAQVTGMAAPPAATPQVGATVGATTGAAGQATTATPPVNPPMSDPMAPPDRTTSSSTTATADTGVASNTSATESDLKAGASVRDASGMEIGRISKVTKGKTSADTQVTLSASGKTVSVPASSLSVSGGALVSRQTKDDIWAPK